MDIERINENTLKLFITYSDIEDRGYSREEIWYNRAKGEELFWDVIGDVNTDDYFDLDGPIWIHINASEVGLEVVVTRASVNNDSETSSMVGAFEDDFHIADQLNEMEESIFNSLGKAIKEDEPIENARFRFKDIDDLVPLATRAVQLDVKSTLYKWEDDYYLFVDLKEMDLNEAKNVIALCSEYLPASKVTLHRLEEYAQVIIAENCFETIVNYF
ncbi:adaptor protein MecA [Lysinibacillus sp. 2017]|uniref:adaptor protein MecA n=1 Tax=unclassified Lysinibacillus TaxID=2636778 RepID=UPI000D528076|nr:MULTISPECIES: adaptor protein MecA [unclassified Lysinibacillus]AWE06444.1 adaptor protein MecA [Lysinibacillus sp. 2017]TGN31210.1 adaptor protein MecA [Lysinibacillus sp. S2017]